MGKGGRQAGPRPAATPRAVQAIGFGRRLGASLIDWIVVGFFSYAAILVLALIGALVGMFSPNGPMAPERLMILLAFVIGLGYFIIGWGRNGQTLGKSMLGLTVVRPDGKPLGYGKAILRYIGYIISGIVFSVGFLWIAFDKKRQGWHDKMAGSVVVNTGDEELLRRGSPLAPEKPGTQWTWIVLWVITALLAPAALFGSLWLLGPAMSRSLLELLGK